MPEVLPLELEEALPPVPEEALPLVPDAVALEEVALGLAPAGALAVTPGAAVVLVVGDVVPKLAAGALAIGAAVGAPPKVPGVPPTV